MVYSFYSYRWCCEIFKLGLKQSSSLWPDFYLPCQKLLVSGLDRPSSPHFCSSSSQICFGLLWQSSLMSCLRYGTIAEIKERRLSPPHLSVQEASPAHNQLCALWLKLKACMTSACRLLGELRDNLQSHIVRAPSLLAAGCMPCIITIREITGRVIAVTFSR